MPSAARTVSSCRCPPVAVPVRAERNGELAADLRDDLGAEEVVAPARDAIADDLGAPHVAHDLAVVLGVPEQDDRLAAMAAQLGARRARLVADEQVVGDTPVELVVPRERLERAPQRAPPRRLPSPLHLHA